MEYPNHPKSKIIIIIIVGHPLGWVHVWALSIRSMDKTTSVTNTQIANEVTPHQPYYAWNFYASISHILGSPSGRISSCKYEAQDHVSQELVLITVNARYLILSHSHMWHQEIRIIQPGSHHPTPTHPPNPSSIHLLPLCFDVCSCDPIKSFPSFT